MLLTTYSLLLRALVSPECSKILRTAEYDHLLQVLGDLCFTQLAELRHRGAFSTVAQTFALVCRQSGLSNNEMSRGLVPKWYTVIRISARLVICQSSHTLGYPYPDSAARSSDYKKICGPTSHHNRSYRFRRHREIVHTSDIRPHSNELGSPSH